MIKKLSSKDFVSKIESFVTKHNVGYTEAVLDYCEKNKIEFETVAKIIKQNKKLKEKIEAEGLELKMIRK